MKAESVPPIRASRSNVNGKLIFDLKDGKLRCFPVVDSDQELGRLLSAFRVAVVVGDLWALIEE